MRPIVATIVLANLVNAALVWAFVFGRLGSPALGAIGAGIASTVARSFMLACLVGLAWEDLHPLLLPWRPSLRLEPIARMIRLGVPIGITYQLEFGAFTVIALLM